jgi:hypothetical protein
LLRESCAGCVYAGQTDLPTIEIHAQIDVFFWLRCADLTADLRAATRPLGFGPMRDQHTIDSELRLVAALCRTARERAGPLASIDVADALLDERP